jgi:ADP-ribose pyrophosphatase YjhB (NUDIX family)
MRIESMADLSEILDEAEVVEMAAAWGEPRREHVFLVVEPEFWFPWEEKWHTRRGEVMFLLPRPGGLLLHRKGHYPPEAWRLLTGGIERGESARLAIEREPVEEVGLELPVRRYAALLTYTIECQGQSFPWATHIFLMPFTDAPLRPSHDDEIEETRVVPLDHLEDVAVQLENLASPWHDWGRFRAVAHRVVRASISADEVEP